MDDKIEVYKSIFNITEQKNKFELYIDKFDDFSFAKSKDAVEEISKFPVISPEDLQNDTLGPIIISIYRNLELEKSSTDGCTFLFMTYVVSRFRDFESYLRIGHYINEDDIHLNLKQYNSNSVTYEIRPGNYSIEDVSEIVYKTANRPGNLQLEYDDINMKTELILNRFYKFFEILWFKEKHFF